MRRMPFTVVLTDNRGYGCINRLQQATGGAPFNNMYADSYHVRRSRRSTSSPMPPAWGRMRSRLGHRRA
jgi:TPP-dependent trihydroxycyclohexane-1,2-dione (THcHDO) dehydratase